MVKWSSSDNLHTLLRLKNPETFARFGIFVYLCPKIMKKYGTADRYSLDSAICKLSQGMHPITRSDGG
jgi:hypothetical protein